MKIVLLTYCLLFVTISLHAQAKDFPEGACLSIEELKNRTPLSQPNLMVTPKWVGKAARYRVTNYYQLSKTVSAAERHPNQKMMAYVKGDSLFINNLDKNDYHFSLALTTGNFIVFPSHISKKQDPTLVIAMSVTFGLAGYILASATNTPEYGNNYILSLRTGNIRPLNKEYVKERLKEYPSLYQQFEKERRRPSLETILKYVDRLNDQIQ